MPEEQREILCRQDRDLLIELRTEMKNVRQDIKNLKEIDIKELRDSTILRIITLERDKADRVELDALQKKVNEDIDKRVQKLENTQSKYLITLGLYSLAVISMIGLLVYHIFQTTPK